MFTVGSVVHFGAEKRPLLESPVFRSMVKAALAVHHQGVIGGAYGPQVLGTLHELFFQELIQPPLIEVAESDVRYQECLPELRLMMHGNLSAFQGGTVEIFNLDDMWVIGADVACLHLGDQMLVCCLQHVNTIDQDGQEAEDFQANAERLISLEGAVVSVGQRLFIFSPVTQECYIFRRRAEGHQALYPFNPNALPSLYGFGVSPSPHCLQC